MSATLTLDDININELGEEDLETPQFPIIIFQLALWKDVTDGMTAGFASFLSTPILTIIIMIWMLNKGSFMQKYMRKWFFRRLMLWFIAKFIPIANWMPLTTTLVYMTHKRETKMVQELDKLIEHVYRFR